MVSWLQRRRAPPLPPAPCHSSIVVNFYSQRTNRKKDPRERLSTNDSMPHEYVRISRKKRHRLWPCFRGRGRRRDVFNDYAFFFGRRTAKTPARKNLLPAVFILFEVCSKNRSYPESIDVSIIYLALNVNTLSTDDDAIWRRIKLCCLLHHLSCS